MIKKYFLHFLSGVAVLFMMGQLSFAEVGIGRPAPEFSLPDSNGQTRSLSDYKGKFVVLEWVNFGCPFVIKHYGSNNMQQLQKEMVDKGVVWLSINSSAEGKQGFYSPQEVNALLTEKNANPTAYLIDTPGTVGKLYGAATTPHIFIIDPAGILVYQGAIDDKPTFDPQDIPGARNYVREAMGEAMAGKPIAVAATKSYGCSVKY